MDEINAQGEAPVIVRQVKYLNNIVAQDRRVIKRVTKPMCSRRRQIDPDADF